MSRRLSARLPRRLAACLWLVALPGCLGAIGRQEIPPEGIALYWYDVETQRERAEYLEEADPETRRKGKAGVAHVDDMTGFLNHLLGKGGGDPLEEVGPGGIRPGLHRRFPGRLAFLDPHTEEVTPLERSLTGAIPRAWSADRKRLLFSQVVGRFRQLFEYRPEAGEVRQLTRGPAVHSDGCFGPEGRYVYARAQVRGDQPFADIVMTRPGGGPAVPISKGPGDYGPACAPDGSAVVWVSARPRGRDLIMSRMPPVDGEPRNIGVGRSPAFSPDGQWVVYSAPYKRDRWRLYRVRADGSGRKAIGQSTLDELQPSFSPDGRLVVYVADDGYERRIYLRRFDGSGDRVLLRAGGGEYPVW